MRRQEFPHANSDWRPSWKVPPKRLGKFRLARHKMVNMYGVVRGRTASRLLLQIREMLDALSAPGQGGYPSSMNTDACSDRSVMEDQGSELAFTSSVVGRCVLVR